MRWSSGTVAVVGLGYVGLPTALALLAAGAPVVGVDTDPRRLEAVRRGRVDLLPDDRRRLAAHLGGPSFTLTADPARLAGADAVVICVPTPVDARRRPEPTALRAACAAAVARAHRGQTLVLVSTSWVGTTRELLLRPLEARGLRPGQDVFVACAPERIDPGNAAHPQHTVRRVVGGVSPECARRAAAYVEPVAAGIHVVGSPEAAELTKLLENTSGPSTSPSPTSSPPSPAISASTPRRSWTQPPPSPTASCPSSRARGPAATAFPATPTTCCGGCAVNGCPRR